MFHGTLQVRMCWLVLAHKTKSVQTGRIGYFISGGTLDVNGDYEKLDSKIVWAFTFELPSESLISSVF